MRAPTRVVVSMGRPTNRGLESAQAVALSVGVGGILLLLAMSLPSPPLLPLIISIPGAVFWALGLGGAYINAHWLQPHTVSVRDSATGLTLASHERLTFAFSMNAAVALMVPALIYLDPSPLAELGVFSRRGVLILPVIALGWLAHQLWSLRRPAGLTLTTAGLFGVRGGPDIDLAWDELAAVWVAEDKFQRTLHLDTTRRHISVRGAAVGGDLYAVATVIDFYLKHPAQRHLLEDGAIKAVQHVDAQVLAGHHSAK